MTKIYFELYYYHSIPEILLWCLLIMASWTGVAFISTKHLCCKKVWIWINRILLGAIIIFIIWITIWNRSSEQQELSLIPFSSFIVDEASLERYRSVIANIILFLPFGLSMPFVVSKLMHPVRVTIFTAAALSILIEATQYVLALGLCETDDVLANTLGATFGCLAFVAFREIKRKGDVSMGGAYRLSAEETVRLRQPITTCHETHKNNRDVQESGELRSLRTQEKQKR